jgi:hypothetical protein
MLLFVCSKSYIHMRFHVISVVTLKVIIAVQPGRSLCDVPPKSRNIEVGKQQRRPLPGNGSISVVSAVTNTLEIKSTCYQKMKTRSRDNADKTNTLDTVTSETRNRTLREGVLQTVRLAKITDRQCGGGVEYLHRSPASRRRRRKGKSRI